MDNFALVLYFEPKNVVDTLRDDNWILAMEEELNQFERNKIWTLVEGLKIILLLAQNGFLEIKLMIKVKLWEIILDL